MSEHSNGFRLRLMGFLFAVAVAAPATAEDWIGFRGGPRYGVSQADNLPTTWNDDENIVWRKELPGLGTSSPVIVGDKIFVTCYSGYAETPENAGDQSNLVRHVIALDKNSGGILWSKAVAAKLPESEYTPGNNSQHGYASSTPTSDGERLYVFFGKSGVFCFDLDGNEIWSQSVGDDVHGWGSSNSPLLVGDHLIVNASIESGAVVALNKANGQEAWRYHGVGGEGVVKCWTSPVVVHADQGPEVVLNMTQTVVGIDPSTGKELWRCNGADDSYVCPSPIVQGDVVYVIGGRDPVAMAIRSGGRGDVDETHVIWRVKKSAKVTSPVYIDGYLYWVHDGRGMVYCLDALTGETKYEERLDPRPGTIYGSITAGDGKLYTQSQENGTFVLAVNPDEVEQLAVNEFQFDQSRNNACAAISENRIYLRTDKAIYCIGNQ